MPIFYLRGDATLPQHLPAVIAHIVNDVGAFGKGFAGALALRYPEVERHYRAHYRLWSLGDVGWFVVDSSLLVAQMVAQRGLPSRLRRKVVDYVALQRALAQVLELCAVQGRSLHVPRIGTGYGGGNWSQIEAAFRNTGYVERVPIYVYDPE